MIAGHVLETILRTTAVNRFPGRSGEEGGAGKAHGHILSASSGFSSSATSPGPLGTRSPLLLSRRSDGPAHRRTGISGDRGSSSGHDLRVSHERETRGGGVQNAVIASGNGGMLKTDFSVARDEAGLEVIIIKSRAFWGENETSPELEKHLIGL